MRLIIDIPDHLYSVIKNKECTHNNVLTEAVANGTPIPDKSIILDESYNAAYKSTNFENKEQANEIVDICNKICNLADEIIASRQGK